LEWETTTATGDWGLPTFTCLLTSFFLGDMDMLMQLYNEMNKEMTAAKRNQIEEEK
jgi:hypothetical protein